MSPGSAFTTNRVEPGELSDGELVASVVLQDEEAFAELFRRHAALTGAAARMILGHGTTCDDVVAEVFLALWVSPERFEPERGSLLGFLRMQAKRRSIDIVRSETARIRRERAEIATTRIPEGGIDSGLLASEVTAGMDLAIASLPAHEQVPIDLAFHQGMTYASIAVHLGIPEGTLKSRIRAGLRHLRDYIEADQQAAIEGPGESAKPSRTGSADSTGGTRTAATGAALEGGTAKPPCSEAPQLHSPDGAWRPETGGRRP